MVEVFAKAGLKLKEIDTEHYNIDWRKEEPSNKESGPKGALSCPQRGLTDLSLMRTSGGVME